ncbi:HepT-like ribonuclease domain-containing protein [Clostridium cadaveris]|uniref:HepT-like ribonuclease domain-containing protein n=1 Tax=Clostridium cadaveris TaxID=1529 RepID=UPI0039968215
MNEERLLKVIEDMREVISNLKECTKVLEYTESDDKTIFIEFGLKQIFVNFFITVESLTSMLLKEFKRYRIGIDMKESLNILLENKVLSEEEFIFLNEARLLRNRISHRYKEPSKEELLTFINMNTNYFDNIINIALGFLIRK